MQGLGGILDVAVGMMFIYLLLSLICSGINELVAWILSLRAATLRAGIRTLIADESIKKLSGRMLDESLYMHALIRGQSPQGWLAKVMKTVSEPSYISSENFALALLDSLAEHGFDVSKLRVALDDLEQELREKGLALPSGYHDAVALLEAPEGLTVSVDAIRAASFGLRQILRALPESPARAELLKLVDGQETLEGIRHIVASLNPESAVRRQLQLLLETGPESIGAFRKRVEHWFDQAMDRVTGVYKRRLQLISLAIGILLAGAGGVDTVTLANALMHDGALRQATVAAAVAASQSPPPAIKPAPPPAPSPLSASEPQVKAATATVAQALDQLTVLKLPIGLDYLIEHAPKLSPNQNSQPEICAAPPCSPVTARQVTMYWLLRVLGILFTGLALSFGAPFWFDVMSKLVNVRSAGPRPEKSEDGKAQTE